MAKKVAAASKKITIDDVHAFFVEEYGAPLADDYINLLKHVSMRSVSSASIDADDDEDGEAEGNLWDNLDTEQLKAVAATLKIKAKKKAEILEEIEALFESKPKTVTKAIEAVAVEEDDELEDDEVEEDDELGDDEEDEGDDLELEEDDEELDDEDEDEEEEEKPAKGKKGAAAKKAPAKAPAKKAGKAAKALTIDLAKAPKAAVKAKLAALKEEDVTTDKAAVAYINEFYSVKVKAAGALQKAAAAEALYESLDGTDLATLEATAEAMKIEVDLGRSKKPADISNKYLIAILGGALEA